MDTANSVVMATWKGVGGWGRWAQGGEGDIYKVPMIKIKTVSEKRKFGYFFL